MLYLIVVLLYDIYLAETFEVFLDITDHFKLKCKYSNKLNLTDVSKFKIHEYEFCIYIIENGLIKAVAEIYLSIYLSICLSIYLKVDEK